MINANDEVAWEQPEYNEARELAYDALAAHDGYWLSELLYSENLGLVYAGVRLCLEEGNQADGEPPWYYAMTPEEDDILINFSNAETDAFGLTDDRSVFTDPDNEQYTVVDLNGNPVDLWALLHKWHTDPELSEVSRIVEPKCPKCGHTRLLYELERPVLFEVKYAKSRRGELMWEGDPLPIQAEMYPGPGGTYVCPKCGHRMSSLDEAKL